MSHKKTQLVSTALELFERVGFRAVGIDRILAEAGVAKMTLYKHFATKDDLVAAALSEKDRGYRSWLTAEVERRAASARDRLLAVFEVLDEELKAPAFAGCIFTRAASEYGEADHPAHVAAAEHKRLIRQYLTTLANDAGAAEPDRLAYQLTTLIDGAMAGKLIEGCNDLCPAVRAAARSLIDTALPRATGS
ncbi:MAG: TetR/AcrR family transcriptional regulator [Planctomycetota bacterium]